MSLLDQLDYDIGREIKDQDYDYGDLGDMRPGNEKHDKLVRMVLDYAERGKQANDDYIPDYEKVDEILDGFMPPDDVDRVRKGDDPRKPVNTVMPMLVSHRAQLNTAMHRGFFSKDLFHRFGGAGSAERAAKAALAQKLLGRLTGWFRERLASDIHWGDGFAYGRAYMWGKWSKKTAPSLVDELVDDDLSNILTGMGQPHSPGDLIRYIDEENETRKEGTKWIPLDPYQVLPDGSTTPENFQDSAFFGWVTETDALLLLGMEDDPEEELFNCRALEVLARKGRGTSNIWREHRGRSRRVENRPDLQHSKQDTRCHVVYMFCRLIPRAHGLGDSDKPQIWFFAVGADRILIKAKQLRTIHGGLPVICVAPNSRGHQIAPVSNLMLSLGQQIAVDFLVKQRLDFQDLVKNGKFIFDPNMLDWERFGQGGGPMAIPLKKRAMGKNISEFYHQVQVQDITQSNWIDVGNMMKMHKEGHGLTESAGELPDRPTATGINAIEGRSVTQMIRIALIIDEQSRQEQAYQSLCNVAQWMSTEVILDITGRDDEIIRRAYNLPPGSTGLMVSSWDIDPTLDVIALAQMSLGPKNVSAMSELAKSLMGVPGVLESVLQNLNFEEFFISTFREMGMEDIDFYRYNVTPAPDEYVRQQVQAGNLVPMGTQPQREPAL